MWTSSLNVNQNSITVLVMVEYCELVFISPCLLFQTLIYHLLLKTRWNYKTLSVAFSMDKPIVRGINCYCQLQPLNGHSCLFPVLHYVSHSIIFNTYTTVWIGVSIIDRNACPVLIQGMVVHNDPDLEISQALCIAGINNWFFEEMYWAVIILYCCFILEYPQRSLLWILLYKQNRRR